MPRRSCKAIFGAFVVSVSKLTSIDSRLLISRLLGIDFVQVAKHSSESVEIFWSPLTTASTSYKTRSTSVLHGRMDAKRIAALVLLIVVAFSVFALLLLIARLETLATVDHASSFRNFSASLCETLSTLCKDQFRTRLRLIISRGLSFRDCGPSVFMKREFLCGATLGI